MGSIGRHLVTQLASRCGRSESCSCLEVDLRAEAPSPGRMQGVRAARFCDLPRERFLDVDLVIGVTGQPAFRWEDVEMLLIEGRAPSLYLVSGSTKTIEFEHVSGMLEGLLRIRNPVIRGVPCRIEGEELNDPQTGRLLGHTYRFTFTQDRFCTKGDIQKEICFLGNLMPVNFLYYGVPGEVMGLVLSQLLRCSIGLVKRISLGPVSRKSVLAVDHDIDTDGQPLSSHNM
jgi:hypothetical protein